VNASINFKYHRERKRERLHCPFLSTYYWHIAHENFSTPATLSELDIKGCTIIRQKQKIQSKGTRNTFTELKQKEIPVHL
jgi:hypothetical protein